MSLDDSFDGFRDEVLDGEPGFHTIPNLRRGDVYPSHPGRDTDQFSTGAEVYGGKVLRIHPIPAHGDHGGQLCDLLRLLPFMELGQLVCTEEKKQLRIGVSGPKMSERVHGIRRTLPVQFHFTYPEKGVSCYSDPGHFRPDERR